MSSKAGYHLAAAFNCLRQAPGAAFMAAGTVAVALTVTAIAYQGTQAVEGTLKAYGADARITVFLGPTAEQDGKLLATTAAQAAGAGATAEFIAPAVAMKRLREELGEMSDALDALVVNPLPPSIEVKLESDRLAHGDLTEMALAAERLQKLPFAKEVDYGRAFVDRLETLLLAVRALGAIAFVFVVGVALFLVSNVVRLTVYARRDEIDVLRLVGATDGFIAAPFVLEGSIQGLAGGILAALAASTFEREVFPRFAEGIGLAAGLLPEAAGTGDLALLVATGALVGFIASFIAVARFLRSVR